MPWELILLWTTVGGASLWAFLWMAYRMGAETAFDEGYRCGYETGKMHGLAEGQWKPTAPRKPRPYNVEVDG